MKALYLTALIILITVSCLAQADPSQRFSALGSFSNYRFTEEHQYGAQLDLWREGASLVGLFSYSEGLMGDTPTGILEKVSFEPATGLITFSAKLTTGFHGCKIHRKVPSRDLFSFEGTLSDTSVSGTLRRSDALHPEYPPIEERVALKKTDGLNTSQYASKERWETAMQDILKFRGPKW